MKGNITLHIHGLMVSHGQYNTFVREESFKWLRNTAGPLDVPLSSLCIIWTILSLYIITTLTKKMQLDIEVSPPANIIKYL